MQRLLFTGYDLVLGTIRLRCLVVMVKGKVRALELG